VGLELTEPDCPPMECFGSFKLCESCPHSLDNDCELQTSPRALCLINFWPTASPISGTKFTGSGLREDSGPDGPSSPRRSAEIQLGSTGARVVCEAVGANGALFSFSGPETATRPVGLQVSDRRA
jgi:hypothetical protein